MSLIPDPDLRFGSFSTTDVVVGTVVVPIENEDGDAVDLDGWTAVGAVAIAPDGTEAVLAAEVVELVDGSSAVEVTLPGEAWELPGLWQIVATLTDPGGSTLDTEALRFVVEDRVTGWLTLWGARSEWRDAPRSDVALWQLLETAREQVIAWADHLGEAAPARVPDNYRLAQRMQARETWNAAKRDPSNFGLGDADLAIIPRPLGPEIRDVIVPKHRRPVVR